MKIIKGIGILIIAILVGLLILERLNNVDLSKQNVDLNFTADSLFLQLQKHDSLITVISELQDSLLNKKTETIIKIRKEYETNVSIINDLTIGEQVELLTRNLSEDIGDR